MQCLLFFGVFVDEEGDVDDEIEVLVLDLVVEGVVETGEEVGDEVQLVELVALQAEGAEMLGGGNRGDLEFAVEETDEVVLALGVRQGVGVLGYVGFH